MTEAQEPSKPILMGTDAERRRVGPASLLSGDAFSALNICFLATTISGAFSEYLGSPVGAVASMVVFLIFGFAFRSQVPSIERFGDSSYYQGFILTLFALIVALTGKGAHTLTSDRIIQQFGVAIWSTFVGMTGRILIIQFLTTALDQDEEARQSISTYVSELNMEVASTLSQVKIFRESVAGSAAAVAQQLAEEAKKNQKESNDVIRGAMSALVRSLEQTSKKLDNSVEKVAERIFNLEIPADALSGQIRKAAEAMGSDLSKLRAELEQDSNKFANVLRENVTIMASTRSDLKQLKQSLEEANEAIAEASENTAASLASVQSGLRASAQAVQGVEQLGRTASSLAEKLTSLSSALDTRAQAYTDDLEKLSNEMTAAAGQAREEALGLADAVATSAEKMTVAIKAAGRLNEEPQ